MKEKKYMESIYEEIAMETIYHKEEIVALEKFGRFSTTTEAKTKALELELEILAMLRGEEF